MEKELIDVYQLVDVTQLSPVRCADFSEAAAVCFDFHGHQPGVNLEVEGDLKAQFEVSWKKVTHKMKNSRRDMEDTVESGAYCIAMMVVEKLTSMRVVRQSKKRTGFDYWIGEDDQNMFQGKARLEVFGILKGTKAQIERRLKQKISQTRKSDNLNLPAYVVIVEFSRPVVKISRR